ncbi:MAG: condensation domain-containing protein [Actinophytocola sp.]|uniref:condensation domain-containing protein n=1 Tax=Actinophytocola sp. TaxID=1872138 RepID=UPI003C78403D
MTIEKELPIVGDGTERRHLSANQAFMCAFDRGNDLGAFGPRSLITAGWRLKGHLDLATLQSALDDVAARHEGLRTLIVRDDGEPYARVFPPSAVELTVSDLSSSVDEDTRERRAHEFLNEVEGTGRCDLRQMPLLRARLGRFDDGDAVLVLVTHHTVSDAWSIHLILRDVATRYASRRGLPVPELPEMRQYGEHAAWQQQELAEESANVARKYWQNKLAGGKFVTIPPDRVRRLEVPPVYSVYRFLFDQRLYTAANALAKSTRSSAFMVLYACFNLFLHRRTGVNDIVAPTLTSGRAEPEFHETVGPFFNFMPVRTDVSDCVTFRDLVNKTRATLLEAISYELPFREIAAQAEPELMQPFMDPNGVVSAFEVNHYPATLDEQVIGDVGYTGLRRRLISAKDTSEIPDGNLWDFDLDPAGDGMVGLVKYNSLDFDEPSIVAMVEEYRELLTSSLRSPDSALRR